ncbi:MAG: rod shape-determining protein [Firmicutes bacterium]|nr:rod shape-determining protein [Bacillota bacterium]MCL1954048.1 rod shape-determining protein [Bacillota bacterium]
MAIMEIALELGSCNTMIWTSNSGLMVQEPSLVALSNLRQDKPKAFGQVAMDLFKKDSTNFSVVSPIDCGIILDTNLTTQMLREYLKKVISKKAIFIPKFKAILNVPLGLSVKQRVAFETVCYDAGIDDVIMVDSIVSSAVGMELLVDDGGYYCVSNIGGGRTDIAVILNGKVIEGCTLNIGGNLLDSVIANFVREVHGVIIDRDEAIKVKQEIASLYDNDIQSTQVSGVEILQKTPIVVEIRALDIYNVIRPYYEKILDGIRSVLSNCPPQVVQIVQSKGIYLCGGASQIPALDLLYRQLLGINVYQCQNARLASIMGAGRLIEYKDRFVEVVK